MPSGPTGLEFVTSGTYQREVSTDSAFDLTAGTEKELPLLATHIVCTEDALLSWIRMFWNVSASDERTVYEWFVIRCQAADSTQDLSTNTVVEDLQRAKKILKRGLVSQSHYLAGGNKIQKLELFNVKLSRGEELRLLIRPLFSNTANHVIMYALLEWRQVGA